MTAEGTNEALPHTLPARWYHDPDVWQAERDAVFRRHWTLIGREAELARAGDYIADDIAGWPVFVIRARDGTLSAFHNVCRHRAGPLVAGAAGHCAALRCRYHGWVYDTDGTLHRAPGLELGRDLDPARFGLFPVRVDSWNGLVFVCLDAEAVPLADWLGDIVAIARAYPTVEELDFTGTVKLAGRTNWKAYSDNACEGYHVGFVHGALAKAVSDDEIEIRPYENGRFVGFDVAYQPTDADPTRHGRGFWIYKFPCLLLHFAEDAFNCERVKPLGSASVELTRTFWCDEARVRARGIDGQAAVDASRTVMQEDLAICEAVQRNLEAGVYETGRLAPAEEIGTIYFQHLVREALGRNS